MAPFSKHFDFNLRRDHQKISFERRDFNVPENAEKKKIQNEMG